MRQIGTKNLSFTQRLQIETLLNAKKLTKQEIANIVGIKIRALYYELKRGAYKHKIKRPDFWYGDKIKLVTRYSAQIAQDRYKSVCSARGRPLKIGKDFAFVHYIEAKVHKEHISAHAAWGQLKHIGNPFATNISKTTLYKYIKMGLFKGVCLEHRKKEYRKQVAKRAPRGTSIEKRPAAILTRNTFGNWEMDCVCGTTKDVILALSERKTRYEILFKMSNQKATSVVKCLNILERRFGKDFKKIFKTITVDNGVEFSNFAGMEKSSYGNGKRTSIFYCHPYCSCERGTNERLNREIRRRIPKGSNISCYTSAQVQNIQDWLNNYPRKVLGFATAAELFDKELQYLA